VTIIADKILRRSHLILPCLLVPFLFVTIPPMVDGPGHIAAAAIELASPDSALAHYYTWQWSLNLNMAGEVFLKCLAPVLGIMAAGWWLAVLSTLAVGAGAVALARALNPRGCHAIGWSLLFVLGYPWVWGFFNYQLAAGGSLLVFALSTRLRRRPVLRAALLAGAQPLLLMCHGIGGIFLPVLVVAEMLGRMFDDAPDHGWSMQALRKGAQECLVLVISPLWVMALSWRAQASGMAWAWHGKLSFIPDVLRDQNRLLDIGSAIAATLLLLTGWLLGARWRWRCAIPALAMMGMYALMPAHISGGEACDVRILSMALMVCLALQDWQFASRRVRALVLASGIALLLIRLAFTTVGFVQYDTSFRRELAALDHVRRGSRMLVFVRHECSDLTWRGSRLDHVPALASVRKDVWINNHWTIPGLDMMQSQFDPSDGRPDRMSSMVWGQDCIIPGRNTLDAALAMAPRGRVDYIWLVDTGAPLAAYPDLREVWSDRRSHLYEVRQPRMPGRFNPMSRAQSSAMS
jgi:hypothetical protein